MVTIVFRCSKIWWQTVAKKLSETCTLSFFWAWLKNLRDPSHILFGEAQISIQGLVNGIKRCTTGQRTLLKGQKLVPLYGGGKIGKIGEKSLIFIFFHPFSFWASSPALNIFIILQIWALNRLYIKGFIHAKFNIIE